MDKKTRESITESEFYMWRAVLAFSMVDNTFSLKKQKLLRSYFSAIPFSRTQIDILKNNLKKPQNVKALYHKITQPKDKEHFYTLVRDLAWYESGMEKQVGDVLRKESFPAESANDDFLISARQHSYVNAHYQQYAKADMMDIFRVPPTIRVSV